MRLSAPIFHLKRRARLQARNRMIPLHKALDQIASEEGYKSWSHLSASLTARSPAQDILAQLHAGDLVLLGARPGQGKTLLGIDLAIAASKTGRHASLFTLDCTHSDVLGHMRFLGTDPHVLSSGFRLDTSDEISADYITGHLEEPAETTFVVIDYLQLLDQRRQTPELGVADQNPA
ncbi:DNA helicase [Rhodophyticola sp. CCM32]|uniref:DNA helicase n=1 Tax=Rhodophyticola sp. CCM32 TaxID=2916397 RepID=UPI001EE5381B|nr:DNA helicase [Rhodophyticola sp. CCM32]